MSVSPKIKHDLYVAFRQLHDALADIRRVVDSNGDPEAGVLIEDLEFGAYASMRKLRTFYGVPYDTALLDGKEEKKEGENHGKKEQSGRTNTAV